jgi:DNA-binding MarR family transcriptional regulator
MSVALDTLPRSKRHLRMWVQMLRVTHQLEGHLREYLRVHHGSTLPRFDVMAALDRNRDGVTMSELSRMLLVSNGNVTAVVDRLEKDGLAKRTVSKADRRIVNVALTPEGRRHFEMLAEGHEREVNNWFAGMPETDIDSLTTMLKRLVKEEPN